jgi:CxxC motif-containing protein (DUF1111 family)
MIFAGEAYNVEMGISNELFTQDRPLPGEDQFGSGLPANCLNLAGVGYPEDITHSDGTSASTVASDVGLFNVFMQFLDQPTPSTTSPGGATSIANGRRLFSAIGCALCHTPMLTTQASKLTPDLGNATANLFSDVEIHHMGVGLADNVSQGGAGGDQFRHRSPREQRLGSGAARADLRPTADSQPAAGHPELPALALVPYHDLSGRDTNAPRPAFFDYETPVLCT